MRSVLLLLFFPLGQEPMSSSDLGAANSSRFKAASGYYDRRDVISARASGRVESNGVALFEIPISRLWWPNGTRALATIHLKTSDGSTGTVDIGLNVLRFLRSSLPAIPVPVCLRYQCRDLIVLLSLNCAHDYYGNKCDRHCIKTERYVCNVLTGDKSCNFPYYGEDCEDDGKYSIAALCVIITICLATVLWMCVAEKCEKRKIRRQQEEARISANRLRSARSRLAAQDAITYFRRDAARNHVARAGNQDTRRNTAVHNAAFAPLLPSGHVQSLMSID